MKRLYCDKCKKEIVDTSKFFILEIQSNDERVLNQWEICEDCQKTITSEMKKAKLLIRQKKTPKVD